MSNGSMKVLVGALGEALPTLVLVGGFSGGGMTGYDTMYGGMMVRTSSAPCSRCYYG